MVASPRVYEIKPLHVLAEFSRVTNAVTQTLAAQIDSGKGQLKEAQGLLSEYEAKIEELTNALAAQQKTDTQRQLDFERSLAAAQALVEDGAKREASLQKQMNTLRQELQAAELKAAISDIQRQEVEKQKQRLEQEITTIKK